MVKLDSYLKNLKHDELVGSIYLISRILFERRSRRQAEGELKLGVSAGDPETVENVVLNVLSSIEKDAGTPIETLPEPTRKKYSAELDQAMHQRVYSQNTVPDSVADAELVKLRSLSISN